MKHVAAATVALLLLAGCASSTRIIAKPVAAKTA